MVWKLTLTAALQGSLLTLAGMEASARAATIPYHNTFDGTGHHVDLNLGGNGGTETTGGAGTGSGGWTVGGGLYTLDIKSTTGTVGASNISTATMPFSNVAGEEWVMSSQFTVNSATASATAGRGLAIGFGAFGSNADFSGAGAYYLADLSVVNGGTGTGGGLGSLRILSLNGANGDFVPGSNADAVPDASIVIGTTYTLKLVGQYTGSSLQMTLGLYDAGGMNLIGSTVSATDPTPLSGTNFGYRHNYNDSAKSFNVSFDNFQVVPEPALMAIVASAVLLVMRRRRAE